MRQLLKKYPAVRWIAPLLAVVLCAAITFVSISASAQNTKACYVQPPKYTTSKPVVKPPLPPKTTKPVPTCPPKTTKPVPTCPPKTTKPVPTCPPKTTKPVTTCPPKTTKPVTTRPTYPTWPTCPPPTTKPATTVSTTQPTTVPTTAPTTTTETTKAPTVAPQPYDIAVTSNNRFLMGKGLPGATIRLISDQIPGGYVEVTVSADGLFTIPIASYDFVIGDSLILTQYHPSYDLPSEPIAVDF